MFCLVRRVAFREWRWGGGATMRVPRASGLRVTEGCGRNARSSWQWSQWAVAGRLSLWSYWCNLKRAVGAAGCSVPRVRGNSHLLLYGVAAFLWDREKISNQEVLRCLKQYEDRVKSQLQTSREQSDSITHSIPDKRRSALFASSSWDSQLTHRPGPMHPERSCDSDGSHSLSLGDDEKVRSLDKQESKLDRFVREAKVVLTEHSQEHLFHLPLVGLRPRSHAYSLSFRIVDLFQSVRRFVFSKITHFRQLTQDQSFIQAFVDSSVQQSHFGALFFMKDAELESEPHFMSQPRKPTDLPLIGLKQRDSKGVPKFFKAVHKFTCAQAAHTSPEHLSYTFEHVLGTDVKVDRDMHLQSERWEEGLGRDGSEDSQTVALGREKRGVEEGEIGGLAEEDVGLGMFPGSFMGDKANEEFSVEHFHISVGSLASSHLTDLEPSVPGGGLMALSVQLPSDVLVDVPHQDEAGVSLMSDNESLEQRREALLDWELLATEKNCRVYRKPYRDTGHYQFKVIGRYGDITAKDYLDVQVDHEARKSWDKFALDLKTVDSDPRTGSDIIHWVMKYPFPMSNREYVFLRRLWISAEEDAIVLINKSVEHPRVPEGKKFVRVQSYSSEMVIVPHTYSDELGFDFELTYFDDPQIYLPSSCVNWVTTTAMPDFLDKIHAAALRRADVSHREHLAGV